MKKIKTLLLTATVMMITAGVINAQEAQVTPDTARVSAQQAESQQSEQTQSQVREQTQTQTKAQAGNSTQVKAQNQGANASGVKKVQSARPDWSKARGARPASIERPSGSRIPKGAGRPAGAKGPGRR